MQTEYVEDKPITICLDSEDVSNLSNLVKICAKKTYNNKSPFLHPNPFVKTFFKSYRTVPNYTKCRNPGTKTDWTRVGKIEKSRTQPDQDQQDFENGGPIQTGRSSFLEPAFGSGGPWILDRMDKMVNNLEFCFDRFVTSL